MMKFRPRSKHRFGGFSLVELIGGFSDGLGGKPVVSGTQQEAARPVHVYGSHRIT